MEETTGKKLVRIDFSKGEFMANGKRYIIEDEFSISRWVAKEKYELELGYGTDFKGMFSAWEECYALANAQRFADIAVLAHSKVKGLELLAKRQPAILKYCALFCNWEAEDRKAFSDDMVTQKINDWEKEGIAIGDFFTLAANTIPDFIESYKKATGKYSPNDNQKPKAK